MLTLNNKDPILDNPFSRIGVTGESIASKSMEEAVLLARAVVRALRSSSATPNSLKRLVTDCLDELSDPQRAQQAYDARKGLTYEQEVAYAVEASRKNKELLQATRLAAWSYHFEQAAPPSLSNAVRMSPARIGVTDVVSLLQTPIRETSALSRKLFSRELESLGDGRLAGGAPLPVDGELRRELIGVLHVKVHGRRFQFADVERVIEGLGLVNPPENCIEHYQLSKQGGVQQAEKVAYPQSARTRYSHFHPIQALDRLYLFDLGGITGKIHAIIPKVGPSSCNVLLSRASVGSQTMLCIEGIVESISAHGQSQARPKGSEERGAEKKSTKKKLPSARPKQELEKGKKSSKASKGKNSD